MLLSISLKSDNDERQVIQVNDTVFIRERLFLTEYNGEFTALRYLATKRIKIQSMYPVF